MTELDQTTPTPDAAGEDDAVAPTVNMAYQGAEIFHRPRDAAARAFSGERLTSALGGQVEIEHLHRYFLARELCRGRAVLDVACGEGYGAALLAQVAQSVVGLDYDADTVAHASQAFLLANLRFLQGNAMALPFADATFDAVVSFETIEHFAGHDAFLSEIRRVLRPGGFLLASSPDRDHYSGPASQPNPFHVRELSKAEFTALLRRYFSHVSTTLQRPIIGSVLMPDGAAGAGGDATAARPTPGATVPHVYERRGEDLIRGCVGLPHAVYVVSIAAHTPVVLPPSIYIDSSDLDGPAARLAQAQAQVAAMQNASAEQLAALEHATLERDKLEAELSAALHAAAEREAALQAANAEQLALLNQTAQAHDEVRAQLDAARQDIAHVTARAMAAEAKRAALQAEYHQAAARAADDLATLQAQSEAERASLRADAAAQAEALRTAWQEAARAASSAETRLAAVVNSTAWKSTWPVRRLAGRAPRVARLGRRMAQALWWVLTGQMPQRLRWWRANRAARSASPAVSPPVLVDQEDACPPISLPHHKDPLVRVIIPSYGEVPYTLRCLASMSAALPQTPFEVVVAEDASGDPAVAQLRQVANITLLEGTENLGFIRNCNAAAARADAEFLLFLNNDTQVQPGWLDALVALMRARPEAGAVGSKLIYPDGRLQEAGGIIWNDASAWNYGRLDDPDKPVYNYVREVDYISGAALLVRRQLFEALGGFDVTYAPAYCEDSDLAFRLRAAGHTVLYQPRSTVVHFEGISHGTDTASGVKAYQLANTARLRARWAAELAAHYPNGTHVMRARDRAFSTRVVLVVDHYVPQPDRDAGSRTILAVLRALLRAGRVVKFWTDNGAYSPGYTEALQDLGIEVLYGPFTHGFDAWIAENGRDLDGVLLSRPEVATRYLGALRRHTRARLAYYGHDLHGARMRRQAELVGDQDLLAAAEAMQALERDVWRRVDVVMYPSAEEVAEAMTLEPAIDARPLVPYAFASFGTPGAPPPTREILFVAGFAHPPNEDAACWFVANIFPAIRACVPGAHLNIVGSNPTKAVQRLAGDGIEVAANVSDAELARFYRAARVAVVPLRYGAGVKLKVVEALVHGLPLVTTPVGAQGCEDLDQVIAVVDEPAEFAAAVTALLTDDAAWTAAATRQVTYARQRFSEDHLRVSLLEASGL